MAVYDFDVAVVGGGSAGYAAANRLAEERLRTVVIEGGEEVGGLCILRGCMPTKALLYAAEVRHLSQRAQTWGVEPGAARFDFQQVMARKDAVIKEFAAYRQQQLHSGKFTFIRDQAEFADPHTLVLGKGRTLSAKKFVIATGSMVAPSPITELNSLDYLTSDDALTLTRLPASLIVLGGGAVGLEFAQFFGRLDVKVTVIQRSAHVLREMDADLALGLEKVLRQEGIELFTGTEITSASRVGMEKLVRFRQGESAGVEKTVAAEEILFALGRVPQTGSLGLDKAGVRTEGGRIVANHRMQTTAEHIYAAGDCTGPHEIVHIAVQQGEVAAHNIAHPDSPRVLDDRLLTMVIFTDPQIATVGLSEKEARARGRDYLMASYAFEDHGKSIIMEAKDGFVKLLADPRSGEILGGGVLGPLGGELIHEVIVAMAKRMTVQELNDLPHYHPTLAEIWTYPAAELAARISGPASDISPAL